MSPKDQRLGMTLEPQPPAVRVRGLSKRFGATVALSDVSVDFMAGEVHCLLGENGAGKSTVGKILAGLFPADQGEIRLNGRPASFRSIVEARTHGIAMVFQELSLAPHLTVLENIMLGTEGRSLIRLIASAQERDRCITVLRKYDISLDLNARVGDLPVAQQQLVEIFKALVRDASVLILDEPTAMLGIREKQSLFEIIRQARDEGKAILFVTHHVDEVVELADRVSLLKDGKLLETFPTNGKIDPDHIITKLAGDAVGHEKKRDIRRSTPVLQIRSLPMVDGSEGAITVHRGEIVGLYGIVGCGREDIAEALVGLRRPGPQPVLLEGKPYAARSPAEARERGVAYLPSGRSANLVLPTRSIRENLTISYLDKVSTGGVIALGKEITWTVDQLRRFATKYRHYDHSILSLSGGNQQKVMLARALASEARLVILEDPTAGVDIETKRQIHEILLERSARDGLSVLFVSGDLLETIAVCDTVYAMYQGKIVGRWVGPTRADESAIVKAILGGSG